MPPPPPGFDLQAFLEHRDFLRALARALLGDDHRAEDAVQDACVRALQHPPRRRASLGGWLARVVRNAALNHRRHERQRPERERRAARPESIRAEEQRDLEMESQVLEAVRGLDPAYRTVVYLRYWRDLGPTAIAAELDMPVATVKTRLQRGVERLREELDRRHGGSRSTWALALAAAAAPDLLPQAAGALPLGWLWKGIVVMQKSVVVVGAAAALLVVAVSVALLSDRDGEPAPSEVTPVADGGAKGSGNAALRDGEPPGDVEEPAEESGAADDRVAVAAEGDGGPQASGSDAGIFGRVVDGGGAPIAGAIVRGAAGGSPAALSFAPLLSSGHTVDRREVGTDADGRFRLTVDEDGPVQLVVEASGFAPYRKEVTGYPDLRTEAGDLVLERGVLLSGRVVDGAGHGVAGVEIRPAAHLQSANVIPMPGALDAVADVTGPDGGFLVDRQAVGAWTLRATSDDHPDGQASGETGRAGERVDGIEIVLEDGLEIAGLVVGAPADEDLWVRAEEAPESAPGNFSTIGMHLGSARTAKVAPDGSFRLRGLEADVTFRLQAHDSEQPFRGRARTDAVEAEAGDADVELSWSEGSGLAFRVVDATNGQPIERFSVFSGIGFPAPYVRDGETAEEHPGGEVRIGGMRPGPRDEAELVVRAPGYAEYSRSGIRVLADQLLDLGPISLQPVPRVRVTVTDGAGRPLQGATVSLAKPSSPDLASTVRRMSVTMGGGGRGMRVESSTPDPTAVTDEEGVALLSSTPGEQRLIKVSARKHADYTAGPFELPIGADFDHLARLGEGATAEVLVVDANQEPVPGARVEHGAPGASSGPLSFGAAKRVTDSEGRVWFRGLEPGIHRFRLAKESPSFMTNLGGRRAMTQISLPGGGGGSWTEVELADRDEQRVVLGSETTSTLEGIVTEAGQPLAGAKVALRSKSESSVLSIPGLGGGPSARTDGNGSYSIEEVEEGEYVLTVTHPSRALPWSTDVEVRGAASRGDVDLDVATVAGRVTDSLGEPLAGVRVHAERARGSGAPAARMLMVRATPSGGAAPEVAMSTLGPDVDPVTTDEDGRYLLRGLPSEARLIVKAEAENLSPAETEPFELLPYEEREGVDLALIRGGSIRASVTGSDGQPVASSLVSATREGEDGEPSGPPEMALTDETGVVVLGDLEPGRWTVTAQSIGLGRGLEAMGDDPAVVDVIGGEVSEVPLVLN